MADAPMVDRPEAPRVSVIVPVFNGEPFLAEALDSIVRQTSAPAEIVVVDDGSTDGSAAIARSYPIVRCVAQANAGPSVARNHGIREAMGEFIAFLDADDRWPPDKLARQLRRFAERADLDVIVGHARMFSDEPVPSGSLRVAPEDVVPAYSSCTALIRRRAFDRIGVFDERLGHADDTDWFLRARDGGLGMELLPDVLLERRLHRDNRSRHHATRAADEYMLVVKRALDRRRIAAPKPHGT